KEGEGWSQVTGELAMERSGPERFLSCLILMQAMIAEIGANADALQQREVGRLTARLMTLRQMSLAVTHLLDQGENPSVAASCVKDLGAVFEQELPEIAQLLCDVEPTQSGGSDLAQVMAYLTQQAPSFSLRGGTREILRGIIARGLGLR
ncbi:MAG: acyl-CoA dehydrogenase family protein, partial [Spongiibacter sp.]